MLLKPLKKFKAVPQNKLTLRMIESHKCAFLILPPNGTERLYTSIFYVYCV